MFKRLIISNRFFIRGSRDLFKKTTGSTPTGTSSGSFPYKFGGIANHPSNDAGIQLFGKDHHQQFTKLYGQLLDSIVNKDKTWLNSRVENKLVDALLSENNLRQINKESPIQFLYFSLGIGLGVKFERTDIKYNPMVQKNNIVMYTGNTSEPSQMMKYVRQGIPFLISYHMAVKTSRKLVLGQSDKKGEEVHLLTFQQESKLEFKKVMSLMTDPNNSQNLEKTKKMLLGSKQLWRIGNIDDFLPKRY